MENDVVKILNSVRRKYDLRDGNRFKLIIIENDNDFTLDNSWIVMYAKDNKHGYSTTVYLVKGEGKTLSIALENFLSEVKAFEEYLKKIGGIYSLPKNFCRFSRQKYME